MILPGDRDRSIIDFSSATVIDKDRLQFNIKQALSQDADISYKDEENNVTVVTVTKDDVTHEERFTNIDPVVKLGIDQAMLIRKKKKAKNEAKALVKNNYKIGDILLLRGKVRNGSERLVKKFEVKKVIWSVKGQPVNILILKQLSGVNNNITMTKNDCKKYHIKYEEGLQVYSMLLNFSKLTKK